jgi:hypothetical protein
MEADALSVRQRTKKIINITAKFKMKMQMKTGAKNKFPQLPSW